MTGDYTKVPLRRSDPWTGARMQQGRVLVDHEWNLNLDATSRNAETLAEDVIGPSGVVAGTHGFEVSLAGSDLEIAAGHMWIGGMLASAAQEFHYLEQFGDAILPAETLEGRKGKILVYLEGFVEHVQPAEKRDELVDPALDPTDTAARTRVGYRVRFAPTSTTNCRIAWEQFLPTTKGLSTGKLSIWRTAAQAGTDPCNPPGDPRGTVPDGLFRVEVLAGGNVDEARFGWSFEDGSAAVAVASGTGAIVGADVTLVPSPSTKFATADLVELSWLERRAHRRDAHALFTVSSTNPSAAGDKLRFPAAIPPLPSQASGVVIRRWNGEVKGARSAQNALLGTRDLGIQFQGSTTGTYLAGDWWGAYLREAAPNGIEQRTAAEADGTRHAFAPLAIVDLDAKKVHDCRPKFTPLTVDRLYGTCTVSIGPDDDLQAAIDRLPAEGGELCLAAGNYALDQPIRVAKPTRIVITGAGPSTIIRSPFHAAMIFTGGDQVTVRNIRVEGGPQLGKDEGGKDVRERQGALTFINCNQVLVADCAFSCPDARGEAHEKGAAQACLVVRADPKHDLDDVRVERNHFEIGAWQTGILVVDPTRAAIVSNHLALSTLPKAEGSLGGAFFIRELGKLLAEAIARGAGETTTIEVPAADATLNVRKTTVSPLISDFAKIIDRAYFKRHRNDVLRTLMAFGRDVASGHFAQQLRSSSLGLARIIAFQLRAVGEGIVVAGKRIGTIEVLDNVVEDTVQGIHVGISDPTPQSGRESAERILITRNVVHCLVPRTYDGDRLAVFVGNAKSIHVKDTIATVRWAGEKLSERPYALIEGIRVHGQLGPFMVVRQSSLDGFDVGVRIVPLQPLPRKHMWLVAETLVANGASGASFALDAPPEVDREHNVPSAGWRSTWHQIVPISFGGLEGLAFYDRTNGFGEFYTVDSAGNMNLLRQQPGWRKTWDLIVSTQIAGVSGLLFYDRAAGESSLYTVNDHGEMKFLRLVPDQKSWDIIIPIEIGGVDALLFYDRTMGYGEMRNVGSQGELTVAMEHVAWPKSWHQIVPVRVAGTSGLAFYDRGDGRAIVYRIEQDALITQLTNPVENWSKTVDLVVPVRLGGKTGVLLYDSTNGRGEFRTIDAQGKTTVVNTGTQWRKDWKIIVPRTFGGVSGLVFYAPSGARGAFYTLDAKGALTELMTTW